MLKRMTISEYFELPSTSNLLCFWVAPEMLVLSDKQLENLIEKTLKLSINKAGWLDGVNPIFGITGSGLNFGWAIFIGGYNEDIDEYEEMALEMPASNHRIIVISKGE